MAEQVRRHGVPDAKHLKELETENTRLKKLLADALCNKTITFPDGLLENGYRFKAIDFALPPRPRHE